MSGDVVMNGHCGGGTGLVVMTVATSASGYYHQLVESCGRLGLHLEVLGWGEPYPGNVFKLTKFAQHLSTLPADTVCMGVDAYDVLLLAPQREILRKFQALRKDVVFSVEKAPFNPFHRFGYCLGFGIELPESKLDYAPQYLNSGLFIGYAGSLLVIFTRILAQNDNGGPSDQLLLSRLKQRHPEVLAVDMDRTLFLNCWPVYAGMLPMGGTGIDLSHYGYRVDEVRARIVEVRGGSVGGSQPIALHCPGAGNMAQVLKALGYDNTEPVVECPFTITAHKIYSAARIVKSKRMYPTACLFYLVATLYTTCAWARQILASKFKFKLYRKHFKIGVWQKNPV